MHVVVTGGRKYANKARVFLTLDELSPTHIHEGGATGADTLSREWAIAKGIPYTTWAADWTQHGRAAGVIRNQLMLDKSGAKHGVVFPGGRGTADMMGRMLKAHLPMTIVSGSGT